MRREIDRSEWRQFFDGFSRRHDGWLVTLDCERIGCAFRDLPLRGIAVDGQVIEVFAHAPDGSHLAHVVRRPAHVITEETGEGGDVAVTIVDTEGRRTSVQFRAAIPTEMVDGVTFAKS